MGTRRGHQLHHPGRSLKNLGVRWRNAMVRSNASIGDLDENRLIVSYTIPLM